MSCMTFNDIWRHRRVVPGPYMDATACRVRHEATFDDIAKSSWGLPGTPVHVVYDMRQHRTTSYDVHMAFQGVCLSSPASLVISCFSCHLMLVLSSHACLVFLKAGLRPAFFFNNTCVSVCVLVCVSSWYLLLALPPHASLVISCLSGLLESWPAASFLF